ncbi:MAG: right-handed parallel beta-helix repeat-containing protein [Polyangiaceae bacterium]|nr:right-handed parallel beta-helix repeat-containing protein [Polyangiaceae bacterium]
MNVRLFRAASIRLCALVLGVSGCSESPPKKPQAEACPTGHLTRDDGKCQPPGLPIDMECPPGQVPTNAGACRTAGVPPEECGDGFEFDGVAGCIPILPAKPCPFGLMAIPGETACREIAPCGTGTWGDIPIEPNTQFVDIGYAGGDSDGTQAKPWTTIQAGVNAAEKGAIIAVAAGEYVEDVSLSFKRKRIWGRCPSMVSIHGTNPSGAALEVYISDTEVHNLALTGSGLGARIHNASPVTFDHVWVHDTGLWGFTSDGYADLILRNSLVEKTGEIGVASRGGDIHAENSVVRDITVFESNVAFGFYHDETTPGRVTISIVGSALELNHRNTVSVLNTDLVMERVAIREGGPAIGLDVWFGIVAEKGSAAQVRQTTVEGSHGAIFVGESDAVLDRVTLRGGEVLPTSFGSYSGGILISADVLNGGSATGQILNSAVIDAPQFGVAVLGAEVQMEGTFITGSVAAGGHESALDAERSKLTVNRCALIDNSHFGLSTEGAEVIVTSTLISGVKGTIDAGECVTTRKVLGPGSLEESSHLTMRACQIENCEQSGVFVSESTAVLENCVVSNVNPDVQGTFGDGIVLISDEQQTEPSVLSGTLVQDAARAGVGVYGSNVEIGYSSVRCSGFDLVAERYGNIDYSIDKAGDNVCGCNNETELCRVQSPGIAAPQIEN